VIQRKKDELKERMDRRFSKDFQTNRKLFWKAVKAARGSTTAFE
jgi:ribosomal protein S17E